MGVGECWRGPLNFRDALEGAIQRFRCRERAGGPGSQEG